MQIATIVAIWNMSAAATTAVEGLAPRVATAIAPMVITTAIGNQLGCQAV